MAIQFQFNKTSMQSLQKQLRVRQSALPTLKSKESALRTTLQKQKDALELQKKEYEKHMEELGRNIRLWAEFPFEIFSLKKVSLQGKKIAGVSTYELKDVDYEIKEVSSFMSPAWVPSGTRTLQKMTELIAAIAIMEENLEILKYARRKTTQKVNLYEKVQIPEYREALLKIKRYLEDVENLEKAAQKITKRKFLK